MGEVGAIAIVLVVLLVAVPAGIVGVIVLLRPVFRGIGWLIRHIFQFIGSEFADAMRIIGALLTAIVLVPLTLMNVVLGRWSSSSHYGRAIESEMKSVLGCLYRVAIGNPARLLMLSPLFEGIERRIPAAVAHAPGPDKPSARQGLFDGYTIVGSLPGGGSGAKLYVANPGPQKLAAFSRDGQNAVSQVVIKSFSLSDGSTLPQIVRENRALPAAQRLGLILEHELTDDRFFYVTRYVPGESLGVIIQRLHAMSGGQGLTGQNLSQAMGFGCDLLSTLSKYHSGGLWHKDVKPDNIIVSDGRAQLVDFGLVTPLRSSMTLTTHGTEYFRDPEMVRMALRGVKVHEVDGAKFDIYAAGAVLYSMIENSFPAHGGLSQITRKCPEALRWVVRRAMTDYDKRYESAGAMLQDLDAVARAPDPFALRPADLPSVRADEAGGIQPSSRVAPIPPPDVNEVGAARVGPAVEPPPIPAAVGGSAQRPDVRTRGWWTGKYVVNNGAPAAGAQASQPRREPGRIPGMTAAEQLGRARERVRTARERARARLGERQRDFPGGINPGVRLAVVALFIVLLFNMGWIVKGKPAHSGGGPATSAHQRTDGSFEASIGPDSMDVAVKPAKRSGRRPGSPVVGPPAPLGRVLVIKDSLTFDQATQQITDQQLDRLSNTGFTLVGLATPATSGPDQVDAETRLAAELRTELGIIPFHSTQAADVIRAWLGGHADLAMVVWVGRDDSGAAQTWTVAPKRTSAALLAQANRAISGENGSRQ